LEGRYPRARFFILFSRAKRSIDEFQSPQGGNRAMQQELDLNKVSEILSKYQGTEGALIPILQEAQEVYGYLPEEVLNAIGKQLHMSMSRIYGVVTFYAQFYTSPRGRYTVRVCRGTACHVRGGRSILSVVKENLGIGEGETTRDFMFSLETVACLGTCFLAPVMMIDRNYYGKLIPQRVPSIIRSYEKEGKAHD
jgi:NADH-quinone oxidoreductase subunit E